MLYICFIVQTAIFNYLALYIIEVEVYMKFKSWIVRSLGILNTALSLALIYLILFKDGKIQPISAATAIEFVIVITLAISTKFFWYTSTESDIRLSDDYNSKRRSVGTLIEEEIEDARDFDKFIDNENLENYNRYVTNRCGSLTVDNYKLSIRDKIHKLFYKKDKAYYVRRYIISVERKASKIHKLSGANIRALVTTTDGLTDDRNFANTKKMSFLLSSTIFSVVFMFVTAMLAFDDKTDIDRTRALIKMCIYVANILFSILQSVLKARLVVLTEDMAYFNKVISIIEKYSSYKIHKYSVTRVSYNKEIDNDKSKKQAFSDIDTVE